MGNRPNPSTWNTGAEGMQIRKENALPVSELVRKSASQARNYAQAKENAGHVASFIRQNFTSYIKNADNPGRAAHHIALTEPHFIPDIIEDLNEKIAFLQALAIELSKPEYHQ